MRGSNLREFEELVLLSVRMNGAVASGATIQQTLDSEAGRAVSLGAIYTALDSRLKAAATSTTLVTSGLSVQEWLNNSPVKTKPFLIHWCVRISLR